MMGQSGHTGVATQKASGQECHSEHFVPRERSVLCDVRDVTRRRSALCLSSARRKSDGMLRQKKGKAKT